MDNYFQFYFIQKNLVELTLFKTSASQKGMKIGERGKMKLKRRSQNNNSNCKVPIDREQQRPINTSSNIKDIFFKRSSTVSNEKSNHSNVSVQKKKPGFNMMSFAPNNSISNNLSEKQTATPQESKTFECMEIANQDIKYGDQKEIQQNSKVELIKDINNNKQLESNFILKDPKDQIELLDNDKKLQTSNIQKDQKNDSLNKIEDTKEIEIPVQFIEKEKNTRSRRAKTVDNNVQKEQIFYEENDSDDNNQYSGQMIDEKEEPQEKEIKKKEKKQTTVQKKPIQFKKTKEENFVRLDMKKKWNDRFRGDINSAKLKYTKNGRIKQHYKNKVTNEGDKVTALDNIKIDSDKTNNTKSEFYERSQKQNMYVNCLSEGLLITIDGIEDDEQDNQFKQLNFDDHTDQNLLHILKIVYGFENFRSGQLESIKSIISKQSTLVIQSTGHGKSLIYQFPTLFMKGMAIVICPLISLMMDQIQKLPKYIPGVAYNSSLTYDQKQKVVQMIKEGRVKILYISPEVLQSDFSYFFKNLPQINYVCIDEAHCISEWSHNFRTSYLIINDLIQQKLKCDQIVALTATATLQTQQSMAEKLKISNIFRTTSVSRDNLKISISRDKDKHSALLNLILSLPIQKNGSIIIYCKYKYQCEVLAQFLTYNGLVSAAYHSGCEDKKKAQIYSDFMKGDIRIVVATIAFGMGIDKADIRAVVHMNMPKTVENYVQEAGRAGRDGQISYCHMFLDDEDFYRNCGYVYSDAIDYPMLKLFNQKIQTAIWNIEDKTRTVRKKKNRGDAEEIIFDEELMQSAKNKFCYIELKEAMMELDNKKESLQTLLMKLGQFQDQQDPIFKVYPVGYKNCSVWFHQDAPEELAQKNDFIKQILEMSMITNGCYTFNVCDMCNFLDIDPIELQKKLKELYPKVRSEVKEESLIFQLLRPFQEKEMSQLLDKVLEEMLKYEEVSLNKIHFIYCISKISSYPSVKYMFQNKLFEDDSKMVSMSKYFDQYFNYESTCYIKILQEANININQVLPFEQILKQSRSDIISDVNRFLKSEVFEKDEDKQEGLLKNYKNPKVITRIMQGISSYTYDYKEWKKELYEVVEEGISEYLYEYDPVPKRKLKHNL